MQINDNDASYPRGMEGILGTQIGLSDIQQMQTWLIRIQAAVELVLEINHQLDEYSVRKHFALTSSNNKLVVKMEVMIDQLNKELSPIMSNLYRWTITTTIEEVLELTTDVSVMLMNATTQYEIWRKLLASPNTPENVQALDAARASFTEYVVRAQDLVPSLDEVTML